MSTKVTASLVVQFQADSATANDGLVLEIDEREDGLNGGDTSFRPGDTVYYLLYRSDDTTIDTHFVTAGSRASAGSGSRDVDEVLSFVDSDEASLRYPTGSSVSFTWLGDTLDPTPSTSVEGQQRVRLSAKTVGLLRAQYAADYTAHRLSGVPTALDQVMIYVAGTKP